MQKKLFARIGQNSSAIFVFRCHERPQDAKFSRCECLVAFQFSKSDKLLEKQAAWVFSFVKTNTSVIVAVDTIFSQLSEIFATLMGHPGLIVSATMKTGDVDGWDSLKNVEILMACEARWNIRFSSKEIDHIRTVGDLARCIATKAASGK